MGILLRMQNRQMTLRIAGIVCCCLAFIGFFLQTQLSSPLVSPWDMPKSTGLAEAPARKPLVKPADVIVSGLVFYGRRSRVSSLRCYLERNMVDNGGWLDEILWIVNTQNKEDLAYLDEIVASNPARHKKVIPEENLATYTYWKAWRHLERGKYYVKIDDDILWIDDDAIPSLVTHKIENPKDFLVSGNVINNPPLGFMHYRMGALHPYLPEPKEPSYVTNRTDYWKPSQHGFWDGPKNIKWTLDRKPPAYKNHRWLRVADEAMMYQTPAAHLKYEVWGESYSNWAIGAQMHYSLLENIEKDSLHLYKFEKPWVMYGDRIRINFICVSGDDIVDTDPEHWPKGRGDEDLLVFDLPKKQRRHVVIKGNALAAHFQYSAQGALSKTDLLQRYHSLAQDRACLKKSEMR
ncbi:hypothetical protein FZEAL_3489 [Fusarium zealandicum]|uniref:Uncharacterized protein n=1 Tax=Fusarium zealandicum TaxID=1053134 RepID=A0A8H4UPD4_9HYPO|nr:hypothetical protein FZEAL_3489 [Fusarium zealandicum]